MKLARDEETKSVYMEGLMKPAREKDEGVGDEREMTAEKGRARAVWGGGLHPAPGYWNVDDCGIITIGCWLPW